jgi:predicted enzyme related to lactoylglutathione lyase
VQRAAAFYSRVLGWSYVADDGGESRLVQGLSLSHRLASLGEAERYLSSMGLEPGYSLRSTAYAAFAVSDIEAGAARVRAAGGKAHDPEDRPYGRKAECLDDQGMPFALHEVPPANAPRRSAPTGAREGDVAYLTFEVPDTARARAFFGAILGWQFSPGRVQAGWNVEDSVPICGLHGGHPRPRIVPMYRVADIKAAVEKVRSSGGSATTPSVEPYGSTSTCTDDQGTQFYLGQLS